MRTLALMIALAGCALAQGPTPTTALAAAPGDWTGYWTAFITEDWRFRMVTPRKGDLQGVPLTEAARKIANAWDPAADEAAGNQCKAYGAAALMRLASRFHITWQDANTLRIESDAGTQLRLLHFTPPPAPGPRTWQGVSSAQWVLPSTLKVVTTNLRPGYLRRNGVPYSENAALTEYFERVPLPGGGQLLLVTAIVDDPLYLQVPFIVTSQFKKEPDGSKWDPTPCTAR